MSHDWRKRKRGEAFVPWNGVECRAGSRLKTRVNKNLVHIQSTVFVQVFELKTGFISLNGTGKVPPKQKSFHNIPNIKGNLQFVHTD